MIQTAVISDAPTRPAEVAVCMADPAYFDVNYVINPHMAGNLGAVNPSRARQQWTALKSVYEGLGYTVHVIDPVPGLPDLVFMANQSFPAQLPDGRWAAILSHMTPPQRRPEVDVIEAWYRDRDALVLRLGDHPIPFEGGGDALWVPGRRVVFGGWGFRTVPEAYGPLAELLQVEVLPLRLVNPAFYHLDTCLSLLNDHTALYVPEAFDDEGRALLRDSIPNLIPLPLDESIDRLACNGHSPDGRHFIVQDGCPVTHQRVSDAGFEVIEIDVSEFLLSGGSVFCMKLMLP